MDTWGSKKALAIESGTESFAEQGSLNALWIGTYNKMHIKLYGTGSHDDAV